ncbi:ThiF family adenylyltransferase [Deinococcus planocerae]|uniref:ThiF family adenylyltransferase n=1 Tax=Deinococcus planocerae TaxID=1737569 RepID=UPI000C7EAFD4|nr:ThiF family adenylyltransferase [Deinococcus planocerae]
MPISDRSAFLMPTMDKYKDVTIKPWPQYNVEGGIYFQREGGAGFELPINFGWQRDIVDKLTKGEVIEFSFLSSEQLNFLDELDRLGLLRNRSEDYASIPDRYKSNIAFFEAFSNLESPASTFHETLKTKKVVLLGVGGIGSTVAMQLCGLGIGSITLVDKDDVELKNLSRQFLYREADVGLSKLEVASRELKNIDGTIIVNTVECYVEDVSTLRSIITGADLVISVIDSPDNILNIVNEACIFERIDFIAGGTRITSGVYMSVQPGVTACFECSRRGLSFPKPSIDFPVANRVIAPATGMLGSLIVWEALKYLLNISPPATAGRLTEVYFLTGEIKITDSWIIHDDCPICKEAQEQIEKTYPADERRVEIISHVVFEEMGEYFVGSPVADNHIILNETGLILLDVLKSGKTFSQAELTILRKTGEYVDVEDFVEKLRDAGFLEQKQIQTSQRLYNAIPKKLALFLFKSRIWWLYALSALACLYIWWRLPFLLPDAQDLTGWRQTEWLILASFIMSRVQITVHELAHFVAARAVSVPGRFRISRRLFFVVYETDVSSIWLVPKRDRYATFMAGIAVDFVVLLIALLIRYMHFEGHLSKSLDSLASLYILILVNGLVFQALVFLRTDLYAVLVNFFNCRNLYQTNILSITLFCKKMFKIRPTIEELRRSANFHSQDLKALRFFTPIYILGIVLFIWFNTKVTLPATFVFAERAFRDIGLALSGENASLITIVSNLIIVSQLAIQIIIFSFVTIRSILRFFVARKASGLEVTSVHNTNSR